VKRATTTAAEHRHDDDEDDEDVANESQLWVISHAWPSTNVMNAPVQWTWSKSDLSVIDQYTELLTENSSLDV
jgi:hypothetical protein